MLVYDATLSSVNTHNSPTRKRVKNEYAGVWLNAPLPILNRIQPVDARGMFCQRLAIP